MSTVSIETNLERIAIALEMLASQGMREVQLELPIVEKEVAEEPKAEVGTASEMSRDEVKAALDELGVNYNNRTSTSNLYKVFLKAEAEMKAAGAPVVEEEIVVQAQAVEKVDQIEVEKVEVVEELSFDALKSMLSDYSKQSTECATKVKDLIKAFGPSAKLSTLSEAQKKELLFNFQSLNKEEESKTDDNVDSMLG